VSGVFIYHEAIRTATDVNKDVVRKPKYYTVKTRYSQPCYSQNLVIYNSVPSHENKMRIWDYYIQIYVNKIIL
jgi:hypothetical protein